MSSEKTFKHPIHQMWIMLDQTYIDISKCQEAAFAKAGVTLQQYRVLMVIDAVKQPVTPTDIAHWLDRNTNSITLIIDRMEKTSSTKLPHMALSCWTQFGPAVLRKKYRF